MAGQGAGELEAMHLRTGPGGRRARPRHGTRDDHLQCLSRPVPADDVLRAPARQRARFPYRLGDGTGSPVLSASATTARATATASCAPEAGTLTTQMISSAVCALRMLAFRRAAARARCSRER